jgi:nicotinamidase-related amidase
MLRRVDISEGTALILVDLQHRIVDLPVAPRTGQEVVTAAARLRDAFVAAGAPVVLVRVVRADGSDGGDAADGNKFVPAIAPVADEHVITKHTLSAFPATDLHEHLSARSVKRVVVAGIATEKGVQSTAVDAADLGYQVVVVEDATSGLDTESHTTACTEALPAIATVTSSADILG